MDPRPGSYLRLTIYRQFVAPIFLPHAEGGVGTERDEPAEPWREKLVPRRDTIGVNRSEAIAVAEDDGALARVLSEALPMLPSHAWHQHRDACTMTPYAQSYWDSVGSDWQRRRPHGLWREFTNRHQIELLSRWTSGWIGESRRPDLLKTDLFDEVTSGGIVPWLLATGANVTRIDVSPAIVADAVARNPGVEAVRADVRSLPCADASLDVVFSGSTLDHFESSADIQVALGELCRVRRPGGTLILTLDNPVNPLGIFRPGSGWNADPLAGSPALTWRSTSSHRVSVASTHSPADPMDAFMNHATPPPTAFRSLGFLNPQLSGGVT